MRRALASLLAVGALVALLVVHPSGVSVSDLPTGVSVLTSDGTVLFVDKEGLIITALGARDAAGSAIWWCPDAGAYLDPRTGVLFDPAGRRVDGAPAPGMSAYAVRIDADYRVHIADRARQAAGTGSLTRDVVASFRLWVLDKRSRFCASPVHA